MLAALLLIGAAQPALALTLDEARHQGRVGETFSGYIAARQQDGETQALVKRINAGRSVEYQRIAQQNNLTTDQVARIAGEKLVRRAAAGEYVQGINGQWIKK
ncbi:MAG: YdbL family protein [Mixta calida]|nr:YdbL family protein [Mixta calida]